MKLEFDPNEDSAVQAVLLINALTEWLAEQPAQVPRPGKTQFIYRADGSLDSVITEVDE